MRTLHGHSPAGARGIRFLGACLTLFLVAGCISAEAPVFPSKQWERADPQTAGYSAARLEVLRAYLSTLDTTAMMAVRGGRVVFEYGDTSRLSYVASVRKSVLAMLYGNYVASGKIRLDRTLRELDFDDIRTLLPTEREATVEHLITARSGIYHPASNAGDSTAQAPPRGSQKPGAYFLYNNWDFNAAGALFEQMTGKNIYDALESDLAQPIGMQDFDRARQEKSGNEERSKYLAYHMWLSTRDMARLGLVPRDLWGYGYGRWVWDSPGKRGHCSGAYTAMGAFGQYITVLPKHDLVIVHKTDYEQPRPRRVGLHQYTVAVNLPLAVAI